MESHPWAVLSGIRRIQTGRLHGRCCHIHYSLQTYQRLLLLREFRFDNFILPCFTTDFNSVIALCRNFSGFGVLGLQIPSGCRRHRSADAPLIGSQVEHALGLFGLRLTNFISDTVVFAHNSWQYQLAIHKWQPFFCFLCLSHLKPHCYIAMGLLWQAVSAAGMRRTMTIHLVFVLNSSGLRRILFRFSSKSSFLCTLALALIKSASKSKQ